MKNTHRTILSLAIGGAFTFGLTGQTLADATFTVSAGGTAVINLTNESDYLTLTGSGAGELDYDLDFGEEGGTLSNVRQLTINGQGGDDTIEILGLEIENDLTIRTSGGSDIFYVTESAIGGRLTITSGAMRDEFQITETSVGGATSIHTGSGDDLFNVDGGNFEGPFQLRTDTGNDTVSFFTVGEIPGTHLKARANINTGAGDDTVSVEMVTADSQMGIVTAAGMDNITLDSNMFNKQLTVNTGADDDELTATGNYVNLRTELNGSSGIGDVYRQDEQNAFGSPYINRGFEFEESAIASDFNDGTDDGWVVTKAISYYVSTDGVCGPLNFPSDQRYLCSYPLGEGDTSYFVAPAKFAGNLSTSGELAFDLAYQGGSYYAASFGFAGDITLSGGGTTARYTFAPGAQPNAGWSHYQIPFGDSGWIVDNGADMSTVLASVTEVTIRAEYGVGVDYVALDNVELR